MFLSGNQVRAHAFVEMYDLGIYGIARMEKEVLDGARCLLAS